MRNTRYAVVVVTLVVAIFASIGIGHSNPAAQGQGDPIRLKAATFVPTRGQAPAIAPGLTIAGYAEGQRGYYLVQFAGPVEQSWKDQVTAAGAEFLDYVP